MYVFSPTIFGDYVLQDRIGAGGMAEIFLATSRGIEGFEKRLVIKRILPTLSDDDQFVRMFIEEAKLCVALRHPNIVQVYDLGEIDQQYYIAMEYVDGRDLLKTLAACGKKRIGFPTDIALYIVMEVLKGLEYAHHLSRPDGEPLGIIHRDVSPSNVLLSFEGEVKMGDFGIAKASTREKTATGILKGKFGYMAPEQVTGAPIDHRADVFACGIVLYELLTGHRLFAGKNDLMVLERVRDAAIDPLPRHYRPDLDDELEHIVLKALSRRAEQRFQTAGELHDALHDYVYRSRAMVAPAQLGRFMQSLFLADPDEVARRDRIRLPPVPGSEPEQRADSAGQGPTTPTPLPEGPRTAATQTPFGPEATEDERSRLTGGFEGSDETPLLDLTAEDAEALSDVVFISDEYDWGRSERALEETQADSESSLAPAAETSQALDTRSPTVRTDVALEVSDGAVEAVASVSAQAPSPKAAVLELREAQQQNASTDYDLQDDPRYAGAVAEASTLGPADRPRSLATELHRGDDAETRSGAAMDGPVDPAHIVERTRVAEEPPATRDDVSDGADVEPTVRFDSAAFPSLRDRAPTVEPPRVHLVDGVPEEEYVESDEDSQFGTVEVDGGDLPTSEVDEAALRALEIPYEPDSLVEAEGTEVSMAPAATVEVDEDATMAGEGAPATEAQPAEAMSLADEGGGSLADEDDASRTDLYNPVEAGMVAELAARGPARRRPCSRGRPVSMPAEGGPGRRAEFGRRRSSPRRRVATRAPLSVVNPPPRTASEPEPPEDAEVIRARPEPEERAVSTIPAPVVTDRDDTGAGSLVDAKAYGRPRPADPVPDRRASSGVTAALSEARLIDDEIAELRKSSVAPRDGTEAGFLADDEGTADLSSDELTDDGSRSDLRSAILRRQSRRRLVTRSVVLYGDQGEPPETTRAGGSAAQWAEESERELAELMARQASFHEESEMSTPAITNAGQLEDEGAADLFGVLSVLDDPAPFGAAADDELSMETDAKLEAPELFGGADPVRSVPVPGRIPSEAAQAAEYGHTSLGSLAPDESDAAPRVASFVAREESTANVEEAQVLSMSAVQLPAPEASDVESAPVSELELEFTAEGPLEPHWLDPASDPSNAGGLLDPPGPFSEEPTQEQPHAEDSFVGRPVVRDEPSVTSGDRPSHDPALRASSFAAPIPEPTRSQLVPAESPPKPRGNESVLRAVVERQRVAREKNRAGPKRARGTGAPPPARGAPAPDTPPRGAPSRQAHQGATAPGGLPHEAPRPRPDSGRRKAWTTASYVAVALAVALAVAAAVSSLLLRQPDPMPPATPAGGLVDAPLPAEEEATPEPPVEDEAAAAAGEPDPKAETPPPDAPARTSEEEAPAPTEAKRTIEPPPPPAKAPKRRVRRRRRAPARTATADRSKATLRLKCREPVDVFIRQVGTTRGTTNLEKTLEPGWYRVRLSRGGERLSQMDVKLLAGDSVSIPCP